jgi:hypothetical protein
LCVWTHPDGEICGVIETVAYCSNLTYQPRNLIKARLVRQVDDRDLVGFASPVLDCLYVARTDSRKQAGRNKARRGEIGEMLFFARKKTADGMELSLAWNVF